MVPPVVNKPLICPKQHYNELTVSDKELLFFLTIYMFEEKRFPNQRQNPAVLQLCVSQEVMDGYKGEEVTQD